MPKSGLSSVDTAGLSKAGIWVRRIRSSPNILDEAISLAGVLQVWNLTDLVAIDNYEAYFTEISSGDLQPTWIYMIELFGQRVCTSELIPNHPLAGLSAGQNFRMIALVRPETPPTVLGALVESGAGHRMLWRQS